MSQGRMSVFSLPLISSFLKRFLLLLLVAVFVSYRSCYSTYSAMVVAGRIHDLNTISRVFFFCNGVCAHAFANLSASM